MTFLGCERAEQGAMGGMLGRLDRGSRRVAALRQFLWDVSELSQPKGLLDVKSSNNWEYWE
jgi:hypothetical protein